MYIFRLILLYDTAFTFLLFNYQSLNYPDPLDYIDLLNGRRLFRLNSQTGVFVLYWLWLRLWLWLWLWLRLWL
jgi:hypothetical protein